MISNHHALDHMFHKTIIFKGAYRAVAESDLMITLMSLGELHFCLLLFFIVSTNGHIYYCFVPRWDHSPAPTHRGQQLRKITRANCHTLNHSLTYNHKCNHVNVNISHILVGVGLKGGLAPIPFHVFSFLPWQQKITISL